MSGPELAAYEYAVRQFRAWGYRVREVAHLKPLKLQEAHRRPEPRLKPVKRTQ